MIWTLLSDWSLVVCPFWLVLLAGRGLELGSPCLFFFFWGGWFLLCLGLVVFGVAISHCLLSHADCGLTPRAVR